MLNAIKRLTGWPWFVKPKPDYMNTSWHRAQWFALSRLVALDLECLSLKAEIEKARKAKKARKHLYAKLHDLTTERLRIERGI
jgi:hypothetical protein